MTDPSTGQKLFSLASRLPVHVALAPIVLGGAAALGYRQTTVSRQLGVSRTAVEVLNSRCAMHLFGLREDPLSLELAHALPNASALGLGAALLPSLLTHRTRGTKPLYPRIPSPGREHLVDLIPARTQVFDAMIERLLPRAEQLVVLGAGLDVRASAIAARTSLPCFELDQPALQAVKREALDSMDACPETLHFIPVDFQRDSLAGTLAEHGVDPSLRTVFLWEGVTLYLEESAVRATLSAVAEFAAPGSAILADIYADRFLRLGRSGPGKLFLSLSNEAFRFGLPLRDPEAELGSLLADTGLSLGEAAFLGADTRRGCFAAVIEARVP